MKQYKITNHAELLITRRDIYEHLENGMIVPFKPLISCQKARCFDGCKENPYSTKKTLHNCLGYYLDADLCYEVIQTPPFFAKIKLEKRGIRCSDENGNKYDIYPSSVRKLLLADHVRDGEYFVGYWDYKIIGSDISLIYISK